MTRYDQVCSDTRAVPIEEREQRTAAAIARFGRVENLGRTAKKLYYFAARGIDWEVGHAEIAIADVALLGGFKQSRVLLELDRLARYGLIVRERTGADLLMARVAVPDLVRRDEPRSEAEILSFSSQVPGPARERHDARIDEITGARHSDRGRDIATVVELLKHRVNDGWFWFAPSGDRSSARAEAGRLIMPGSAAGVLDIMLIGSGKPYGIRFERTGAYVSQAQIDADECMRAAGITVAEVAGPDRCRDKLLAWGAISPQEEGVGSDWDL